MKSMFKGWVDHPIKDHNVYARDWYPLKIGMAIWAWPAGPQRKRGLSQDD